MMNQNNPFGRYRVPFTDLINLASEKVGAQVLSSNDDFFAPKENLVIDAEPIFLADKYTEQGKWMDGWESRRKRNLKPGNDFDWCVLKLGIPGVIRGVNVDTSYFTGNYPEFCSIEGFEVRESEPPMDVLSDQTRWQEIMPRTRLQGGSANLIPISDLGRWTHLRLNIFPDGGVARLRVYGDVLPDWDRVKASTTPFDFAAALNGGVVVTCNDMFFGKKDNLILPGRAATMGEGWETRRRRGPGYDWIIIQLAQSARLKRIEVDTHHFKGNFPESCSIEGCVFPSRDLSETDFRDRTDLKWSGLLPQTKLQGHHQHVFEEVLCQSAIKQKYDYLRLNIFPDGGISRFRAYGVLE